MHRGDGSLTIEGTRALTGLGMKLVRTLGGTSSVQYESSPPPSPRIPFILDEKTNELIDLEGSIASEEGFLASAFASRNDNQKILYDRRLRCGSPDICDQDATHHMTVPTPLIFRWDQISDSAPAEQSPAGEVANRAPSRILHLDDDVGLGSRDRDHRRPIEGVTSDIPIHRIDTVWSFKGTGQPKVRHWS